MYQRAAKHGLIFWLASPKATTAIKIFSMKKASICLLDDDEMLLRILSSQLSRRRYKCLAFLKTEDFLAHLDTQESADLYIVDYFLDSKKCSGLDVCRKIKSRHRAPVIMLTSNKETDTIVSCLNAGADQYVVKPYDLNELEARMVATMRLYNGGLDGPARMVATMRQLNGVHDGQAMESDPADRFREHFNVNWLLRKLTASSGATVSLTEKEMALFELFVAAADRTLTRQGAYVSIYGTEMDPLNRSIDILVSRLRKKMLVLDAGVDIVTVRGGGYLLVMPDVEAAL
jgi:DNA-binding response OmpR family regulator